VGDRRLLWQPLGPLPKSGKAGIAKVVIRTREYVTALFVRDDALVLMLLRFTRRSGLPRNSACRPLPTRSGSR